MVWIFCLREKGPVILVARTAHHTQTLIASSFDISWIKMVNLLLWEFTYPLIWNQVLHLNRISMKSGLSPCSPWWFQFTNSDFLHGLGLRVRVTQLSNVDAIRTCLLHILLPSWMQTVAQKHCIYFWIMTHLTTLSVSTVLCLSITQRPLSENQISR